MQQWEYFVFYAFLAEQGFAVRVSDGIMDLEPFLERCGANRWDLVSLVPIGYAPDSESPLAAMSVGTNRLVGVLKRSKTQR